MENQNAQCDAMNNSNTNHHSAAGRAIEVQALYEGTPQTVQHYRSTRGGRITVVSGILLICGLLLLVGGAVAFGTQLYSVKRQEVQRSKVREFVKERGLPEHFVPAVRTNRTVEFGGAAAFASGLFLLLLGGFRARDERKVVAFTIGEDPKADYATPTEGLPSAKFPLVAARDDGFVVSYTSAMEGTVTLVGQESVSLFDLARSGAARPSCTGGVFEYRVLDGARCRLEMGVNTFLISSVGAGQDLEKQAPGAILAAKAKRPIAWTTAGSAAVVLTFLMLMQWKPSEAGAMETDGSAQHSNRRIRSLLKQARKPRDPEPVDEQKKPPKDRKNVKSHSQTASSAHNDRRHQRDRNGNRGDGTKRAHNQSRNNGTNVGVVAALSNMRNKMSKMIAYHTTLMADAEDALVALQPSSGPGGDSWLPTSRSSGPGGPFIVGPPSNCVGSQCKGNPWIDNGNPWPNSGPVTIPRPTREYRPHDPVVPQPIEKVEGIGAGTIRRYMRMKRSQFRYCYVNHAMVSNPRAAGTVKVSFIISKKGIVINVKITMSSLNHRATEQCVARAIKRIKFPKTGGGAAFVTYPIRFRAVGRR